MKETLTIEITKDELRQLIIDCIKDISQPKKEYDYIKWVNEMFGSGKIDIRQYNPLIYNYFEWKVIQDINIQDVRRMRGIGNKSCIKIKEVLTEYLNK